VSLFGPKPEGGWGTANQGKVVDVTANRVICEGLAHPHTVTAIEGAIWWLESKAGRIHKFTESEGHTVFLDLPGYLRGLACDGSFLYVGASAKRRTSRSTGVAMEVGKDDELHSWLYKVALKSKEVERRRMTLWGSEIYDLAIVDPAHPMPWSGVQPMGAGIERIWAFEDELGDARAWAKEMDVKQRGYAELSANYYKALTDSVDSLMAVNAFKEAIPVLTQAVEAAPADARWKYLLAYCHHVEGNLEQALDFYALALEGGWSEFWVRYNRGNVYMTMGMVVEAREDLERAVALDPEHEGAQKFLASARQAAI